MQLEAILTFLCVAGECFFEGQQAQAVAAEGRLGGLDDCLAGRVVVAVILIAGVMPQPSHGLLRLCQGDAKLRPSAL